MNKQRAAMQQALDLARECGATDRTVEYGKRMIVEFYTEQLEAFAVRIRADALPALVPTQDIPVCLNCIGQGWEPTVQSGRIPCGHCQPKEARRSSEIEKAIRLAHVAWCITQPCSPLASESNAFCAGYRAASQPKACDGLSCVGGVRMTEEDIAQWSTKHGITGTAPQGVEPSVEAVADSGGKGPQ